MSVPPSDISSVGSPYECRAWSFIFSYMNDESNLWYTVVSITFRSICRCTTWHAPADRTKNDRYYCNFTLFSFLLRYTRSLIFKGKRTLKISYEVTLSWTFLNHHLPTIDGCIKLSQGSFQGVFVTWLLSFLGTFSIPTCLVVYFLWHLVIWHYGNMTILS